MVSDLQKQHERRMEEITMTFEHIKFTLSVSLLSVTRQPLVLITFSLVLGAIRKALLFLFFSSVFFSVTLNGYKNRIMSFMICKTNWEKSCRFPPTVKLTLTETDTD